MGISKQQIFIFFIIIGSLLAVNYYYIDDLKDHAKETCIRTCENNFMTCAEYNLKFTLKGFHVEFKCQAPGLTSSNADFPLIILT